MSLKVPGLDPIHKVTIVPRGRALGLTFSLPEEDRHNYTKEYILGRLAMAYGGRVAEELVFGPEKVTTGASQDIQQATEMARRMVTQFGMSEVVGPIAVGDREGEIFLGREVTHRRECGIALRQPSALGRAERCRGGLVAVLRSRLPALVERETLDREVLMVADGRPLPPMPTAPAAPPAGRRSRKTAATAPAHPG